MFTKEFYNSISNELFQNILPYWDKYSKDEKNTGFFGKIDNDNVQDAECQRSIVMTSRFLWTYSAVARFTKDAKYLEMADFAYKVIIQKYFDKENDGVYWSIMPDGTPKVEKNKSTAKHSVVTDFQNMLQQFKNLKKMKNWPQQQ